jgi:hypothetical protein
MTYDNDTKTGKRGRMIEEITYGSREGMSPEIPKPSNMSWKQLKLYTYSAKQLARAAITG